MSEGERRAQRSGANGFRADSDDLVSEEDLCERPIKPSKARKGTQETTSGPGVPPMMVGPTQGGAGSSSLGAMKPAGGAGGLNAARAGLGNSTGFGGVGGGGLGSANIGGLGSSALGTGSLGSSSLGSGALGSGALGGPGFSGAERLGGFGTSAAGSSALNVADDSYGSVGQAEAGSDTDGDGVPDWFPEHGSRAPEPSMEAGGAIPYAVTSAGGVGDLQTSPLNAASGFSPGSVTSSGFGGGGTGNASGSGSFGVSTDELSTTAKTWDGLSSRIQSCQQKATEQMLGSAGFGFLSSVTGCYSKTMARFAASSEAGSQVFTDIADRMVTTVHSYRGQEDDAVQETRKISERKPK